jgi:arabinofuranan 3-O-arabinosyltransferase
MTYSIFVPCYNEEKILEANIRKLDSFLATTELDYLIWIVDDCSTDRTLEIAKKLCDELDTIGFQSYEGDRPSRRENLLYSMFSVGTTDVIAFIDCDLSTDIKDLPKLLLDVQKGTIVIGNRYDRNSKITRSLKRFIISKVLNLYTKYLFNTKLDDHFIGFKAFHRQDYAKICWCMGISSLRSMWADAEMLIWARNLGLEIKQIPVTWIESRFTKLNYKRECGIILYSLWFRISQWIN